MPRFDPRYITFDCYGTLTRFQMADMTRAMFADRVVPERMEAFVRDFAAYRLDEVLGAWKPYRDVIVAALERTTRAWSIPSSEAEGEAFYRAVPTWGPHPDVPAGLARLATRFPLVILSNASNDQIGDNVAKLGAPFHAVYTAEMAGAYKPRMRAFEYMLDRLASPPEHILHVSSSNRYDLMTAHDMGFGLRAQVARGHEPHVPHYGAVEVADIGALADLLGV
jgi:2-haloacid dehalogenase